MTKTAGENHNDDDNEFFYESLDRILSSSCSCSTSNSNSDDDKDSNYASDHQFLVPKFPMGLVSKYDIWVSEPSSVSERRTHLLRQMGLISDPSLSRVKPVFDYSGKGVEEFGRSVLSDHLTLNCQEHSSAIVQSKSDGDAKRCIYSSEISSLADNMCNYSSVYSRPIISICSESCSLVNNSNNVVVKFSSNSNGIAPVATNKPPSGKHCKKNDETRSNLTFTTPDSDTIRLLSSGNECGNREEVVKELDYNGVGKMSDQVCTIKDLDNGKEFVVNEIREDGMWNKLKEVGTGRQLTMEEFEMCVGYSPIVQELMRRQNVENGYKDNADLNSNGVNGGSSKLKKKGGWFRSIKSVASTMAGNKERRSSDERETSSERGGRRSSSATDDSQDVSFHGPERVRVRQFGKPYKELTGLYKSQEIRAHNGSIWSIKFSVDGKYLASAGEDCVIHVWQVVESERKGDLEKMEEVGLNFLFVGNGSPEPSTLLPIGNNCVEKKRRGRSSISRKSLSLDHVAVPETVFGLSEKPFCSFKGHLDDVLDLSWSKSQHLLSSSMDKTVRLWDLSSKSCLKIFSHSDYVTCIQFNPVDDRYFISGSLDAKVRIWSIPDRQVVDWSDLHEMVTAACYTPDGQSALVGSYKGSCRLYNTSENKLQQKGQINLQNKKKKSHHKKINGFQFAPGSPLEVFITSADSRIRVVHGTALVHKFKGFHNTNSQISAYLTANGKYAVCASEDSHVYIWNYEADSRPSRSKGVTITRSYEHFHCQDVSMAIPWPGMADTWGHQDTSYLSDLNGPYHNLDEVSTVNYPSTPVAEANGHGGSKSASGCTTCPLHGIISSATNGYFFDRISATWPEERIVPRTRNPSPRVSVDISDGVNQSMSAWGMVIVTAGLRGEIRTYQNVGLPARV